MSRYSEAGSRFDFLVKAGFIILEPEVQFEPLSIPVAPFPTIDRIGEDKAESVVWSEEAVAKAWPKP